MLADTKLRADKIASFLGLQAAQDDRLKDDAI